MKYCLGITQEFDLLVTKQQIFHDSNLLSPGQAVKGFDSYQAYRVRQTAAAGSLLVGITGEKGAANSVDQR